MSAVETQPTSDIYVRARLVRWWRWLLLALALLTLLALGVKGWRVYDRAQALRQDARAIQTLARSPRGQALADALGAQLAKTRADAAALRAEAGLFLPITRALGWAPVYGGDLAAAGPLLDAAVDLSAAADDTFAAFGPLLASANAPTGAQIRGRIAAARPQIDSASAAIERGAAAWAEVDPNALSPALRDQLAPLAQLLPAARLGLALAPLLPDVLDDLGQLAPYANGAPDTARLAALGPLLKKTRADIATLHAAAAPRLQAQPPSANQSDTAPLDARPLLDAAADLSVAADEAYAALAPIVLQRDAGQPLGAALAIRLAAARPQIDAARQAADRAADQWTHVRLDTMPAALAARLRPIGGLVGALRDGLELAQALPGLLGADAPAEYLLLAQNPDELRATGGFIGAVGTLTLDHGRPSEITMEYSPNVDDLAKQVYPEPPAPLLRYMNIEMLLFRDANWSPDFPTSAATARDLYKLGRGRAIANVVAFDPYAAQALLEAIGPVTVEGAPGPISAKNVIDYLRSEHDAQRGAADPKAYIGRLANAMIAKVQSSAATLDLWALGAAFRRALNERHLLLHIPSAAGIVGRRGWDGAVQPGPADFLMVVDTNMGYNKANAYVSETISYTVDLSEPSAPAAAAQIHYAHGLSDQKPCVQFDDGTQFASYAGWMHRCLYDYLRVLVPRGSQLTDSTTQPVLDGWMDSGAGDDGAVTAAEGAAGTSELSTFQVIPFGQQRDVVLQYRLPQAVLTHDAQGWHYRLRVQKQAGTAALPFNIDVRLPARATLVDAQPQPAARAGGSLHFAGRLAGDQVIEITFRDQ